jgi:hypothetical protein
LKWKGWNTSVRILSSRPVEQWRSGAVSRIKCGCIETQGKSKYSLNETY